MGLLSLRFQEEEKCSVFTLELWPVDDIESSLTLPSTVKMIEESTRQIHSINSLLNASWLWSLELSVYLDPVGLILPSFFHTILEASVASRHAWQLDNPPGVRQPVSKALLNRPTGTAAVSD